MNPAHLKAGKMHLNVLTKDRYLVKALKWLSYILETAHLTSVLVVSEGSCSLGEIADDYD